MSQALKLLEFLDDLKPKGQCDDCLSLELEIEPRQTVNQICRALAAAGKIERSRNKCDRCGKVKITNSYVTSVNRVGDSGDAITPSRPIEARPRSGGEHHFDIEKARTDVVRICRTIWGQKKADAPPRAISAMIGVLKNENFLPTHIANMMFTVCGLRNVYVYEAIELGAKEISVAVNAKAIVDDWWATQAT